MSSQSKQNKVLLDNWFNAFYSYLCEVANEYLDEDDSEDMVANVFSTLSQKDDLSYIETPKAFLISCVQHACLNYLKAEKRRKKKMSDFISLNVPVVDINNDEFTEIELLRMLHVEIESLPEKCKIIFKMNVVEGISTAEVARRLNIDEQTVRNQKTIAVKKLKIAIFKKGLPLYILFIQLYGERLGNCFQA